MNKNWKNLKELKKIKISLLSVLRHAMHCSTCRLRSNLAFWGQHLGPWVHRPPDFSTQPWWQSWTRERSRLIIHYRQILLSLRQPQWRCRELQAQGASPQETVSPAVTWEGRLALKWKTFSCLFHNLKWKRRSGLEVFLFIELWRGWMLLLLQNRKQLRK